MRNWFLIVIFVCISIHAKSQSNFIIWDKVQDNINLGNVFWMKILNADHENVHFIVSSMDRGKQYQNIIKYDRLLNTNLIYKLNQGRKKTEVVSSIVRFQDSIIEINSLLFDGNKLNNLRDKLKSKTFEVIESKDVTDKELNNDHYPNISKIHDDIEAAYTNMKDYNEIEDDNGNLYVISSSSTNIENSTFDLVCYPKSKQKSIKLTMTIGKDKKILSFRLGRNQDNEILCAGVFSDTLGNTMKGCYSIKYSTMLSRIIETNIVDFTDDCLFRSSDSVERFKNSVLHDNEVERKQHFKYISPKIHFNKNGSFTLITEKYRFQGVVDKSPGSIINYSGSQMTIGGETYVTCSYHFSDLIIANFNKQGQLNWIRRVPKRCLVFNFGWTSGSFFSTFDEEDKLHLVYNDINSNSFFTKVSESTTSYSMLNTNGEITTKVLESDLDKSKYISPIFFKKIDNSNVLIVRFYYMSLGNSLNKLNNNFSFGNFKLN